MFGANLSNILEVAIGLAFVFAVISLIVSAIGEFVSNLLGLRSGMLRQGVASLAGSRTAGEIYSHPLVAAQGRASFLNRMFRGGRGEPRPSYLDPQVVATALIDGLRRDGHVLNERGGDPRTLLATGGNFDAARADLVEGLNASPEELSNQLRPLVEHAISSADGAREQLKSVEESVADWFDTSIARVSGWYKRRIQLWLFAIGLVLAIALNVDALFITRDLYDDPELRASVVESAAQLAGAADDLEQGGVPRPEGLGDALDALVDQVKADTAKLDAAGIPIGWEHVTSENDDQGATLVRAIGWVLTALAVSFGGPFWFDLLGKLVSLRSAGKRPGVDEGAGAG